VREPHTIEFDEVYQGGAAEYKHMIVEYPPGAAYFYILRCDEHGLHFNDRPLNGAVRHYRAEDHAEPSRHPELKVISTAPNSHANVVKAMGLRVLHCDEPKMVQNNNAFMRALRGGYKPFRALPKRRQKRAAPEPPPAVQAQRMPGPEGAITSPTVGKLYLGFYSSRTLNQGWYAVVVLPVGSFREVGLSGSLARMDLAKNIPACYRHSGRTIEGWAEGYEDGGDKVARRKFPVMWFKDSQAFPSARAVGPPRPDEYGWLSALYLRPFSHVDPKDPAKPPRGHAVAKEYEARLNNFKLKFGQGISGGGLGTYPVDSQGGSHGKVWSGSPRPAQSEVRC
jgi:hypothetical protein